jgi:hypothetical protein
MQVTEEVNVHSVIAVDLRVLSTAFCSLVGSLVTKTVTHVGKDVEGNASGLV